MSLVFCKFSFFPRGGKNAKYTEGYKMFPDSWGQGSHLRSPHKEWQIGQPKFFKKLRKEKVGDFVSGSQAPLGNQRNGIQGYI
jgi:hypothetical protein